VPLGLYYNTVWISNVQKMVRLCSKPVLFGYSESLSLAGTSTLTYCRIGTLQIRNVL